MLRPHRFKSILNKSRSFFYWKYLINLSSWDWTDERMNQCTDRWTNRWMDDSLHWPDHNNHLGTNNSYDPSAFTLCFHYYITNGTCRFIHPYLSIEWKELVFGVSSINTQQARLFFLLKYQCQIGWLITPSLNNQLKWQVRVTAKETFQYTAWVLLTLVTLHDVS